MAKKYLLIFSLLVLLLMPAYEVAAETSNVGFVPSNIWYSQDPFEEGDKVKIYTVLFNSDDRELSGTVFFFDKDVLLGKKDFRVAAKSIKDIYIDWTATVGTHTIYGKIQNAKFTNSNGTFEEVNLSGSETDKSARTVRKKIVPATGASSSEPQAKSTTPTSIENIENFVVEKTPDFIAKPLVSAANATESWRTNWEENSENKKQDLKTEISELKEAKEDPKNNDKPSPLVSPFKYIELFFVTLASVIFHSAILFYGILALIAFFLIRYLVRLIF